MDSKDKFNAEKWDSIDEVTPSSVPKYEFEETDDKQTKNFSANEWFVENEDSVDENIDKLKTIEKPTEKHPKTMQSNDDVIDKSDDELDKLSSYSKLKRFSAIVLIIIAVITIPSILLALNSASENNYSDDSYYQDNESTTITTTTTTTTTTEYIEPTYWEGKCGDNATFSIYDDSNNSTPHYVLLIEGKGALWKADDIDWKIVEAKIKEIVVCEGITKVQENQFSSSFIFDNVTKIDFRGSVSYIGKNACANINSLEMVNVDNENCKIDYLDDEGYIYNTLGNTEGNVTVLCYEGSTAEDYVDTWNSNYSNSYKLKFY